MFSQERLSARADVGYYFHMIELDHITLHSVDTLRVKNIQGFIHKIKFLLLNTCQDLKTAKIKMIIQ